jgi:hypothetical protein
MQIPRIPALLNRHEKVVSCKQLGAALLPLSHLSCPTLAFAALPIGCHVTNSFGTQNKLSALYILQ